MSLVSLGTCRRDCIDAVTEQQQLPGCQRFGLTPRNKQGSSEGHLFIQLAASNILSKSDTLLQLCN
jgi:hypothetical protein